MLGKCGNPVDWKGASAYFRTLIYGVVSDRVEADKVADLVLERLLRIMPELDVEDVEDVKDVED